MGNSNEKTKIDTNVLQTIYLKKYRLLSGPHYSAGVNVTCGKIDPVHTTCFKYPPPFKIMHSGPNGRAYLLEEELRSSDFTFILVLSRVILTSPGDDL